MRRLFAGIASLATVGILLVTVTAPAHAASGKVLVFEHEFTALTVFVDPVGCRELPPLAHVLANRTDRPVTVYAEPGCAGPGLVVAPGVGTHVTPVLGSFSV